jgi:hypothetical protein
LESVKAERFWGQDWTSAAALAAEANELFFLIRVQAALAASMVSSKPPFV